MRIRIDLYETTIEEEAKKIAKSEGIKIRDIGEVVIKPHDWGISLHLWSKEGKHLTNCLM